MQQHYSRRPNNRSTPGMDDSTGSQTSAVPSAASCESGNVARPTSVRPVMGLSPIQISST